jgi:hypothetical protein
MIEHNMQPTNTSVATDDQLFDIDSEITWEKLKNNSIKVWIEFLIILGE